MTQYKYFVAESDTINYDIDIWCRAIFGKQGPRWKVNFRGYWFSNEDDYLMFLLTWPELKYLSVAIKY
jgi:hypothetical protein